MTLYLGVLHELLGFYLCKLHSKLANSEIIPDFDVLYVDGLHVIF